MPTLINSLSQEWHTANSGPSALAIGAGDNRLLTTHVFWWTSNKGQNENTLPSLTYGGETMSRQAYGVWGQSSYSASGLALFTLTESSIATAGSGGFGLSWSDYEPDTHGNYNEAFSNAGSIDVKVDQSSAYVQHQTTSHTRIESGWVRASVGITVSSWNVSWNINELNETHDDFTVGFAHVISANSGSENIQAVTSGSYNKRGQLSLLIQDTQTVASGISDQATAQDAFTSSIPGEPVVSINISRRQYASAVVSDEPVYVTLGSTPNSGNLLVAFAGHRVNSSGVSISGSGWTERINRVTGSGDSTIRRQIAVFTKIAGGAEPSSISVAWGASATIPTALVVNEFEGADSWTFIDSDSDDTEPATNPTSGAIGQVTVTSHPHALIGGAFWRGGEDNLTDIAVHSLSSAISYQSTATGISLSNAFNSIENSGDKSAYYTWTETYIDGEMSGWLLAYKIGEGSGAISEQATAQDAFSPKNYDTTLRIEPTAYASDQYDSVFYRPGVASSQFYTEIQTTSGGAWTDISDDVQQVNIYRRIGDLFRGIRKGEAIVTVNNFDGKYTPDNDEHTYDFRPTFPIRVIATYLSNTTTMFTGAIETLALNPDPSQRNLRITAKDTVKFLEDKTITTSLFADIGVNSFVGDILDNMGVTVASVDAIPNTIPVAWFSDRNALNALEEIIESGFYSAYVDGAGVFNFRGRNFELSAGSKIAVDEMFSLDYRKDDSRIFNRIKVGGERRKITTDVHTLSYIVEPIFVSDGSTKDFFLSYFDWQTREPVPATGLVSPPTASEDVLINEVSSGTGTDYTDQCSWWLEEFSEASKCYIYNGSGSDAYITKFQIRGKPARKEPSIQRLREVSSSQAVYGVKDFLIDNKLIEDEEYAGDYADYLKQRFVDPQPRISATIRNENPEAQKLELGNLYTLTNSYLGFIGKGFVIKELEHDITVDRGVLHDVTLTAERPAIDENTIIFTLSDPIKGVLNGSGQLVF